MFHMLAYTGSAAAGASNFDLTAAVDPEISQRNGHYIFTEQYQMLAAFNFEANATRGNFLAPSWNQYTKFNIWPPNRSATIPSNPQLDWWLLNPPKIPQNEEFQIQTSNNLGAASEQSTCFIWIAPSGSWNQNLPRGMDPTPIMEVRCNFTTNTTTANSWSGLGPLTFEQSLRGGTYALVGCEYQGAALQACRFVFPRGPIFHNRRLRPGTLGSQALGDVPIDFTPYQQFVWGEWGRFSTFEPPQVEWWSSAGGAIAVEMRLWLVYLSTDMNVTY